VKEALYNIVKHANASQVFLHVETSSNIKITIHDNGVGIDLNNIRRFSNGLENIKQRMANSKGTAEFINEHGTKVILQIPANL
jgi:two-component system sensor histidine kinase DesK